MDKLFEDTIRDYDGPSDHNENKYNFYSRSSRDDVAIVRDKLNKWFSEFPNEEKKEMKKRFQKDFDSSFYELFLYHLFSQLGFKIEIHPKVPNSKKRPDFLVSKKDLEFYIEAKVVTGKSKDQAAFERKRNEFFDSLNKLKFDRFLIGIDELDFIKDIQPSPKKIIKYLQQEIDKLDADDLTKRINSGELLHLPKIEFEDENFYALISVFPLIEEASLEKHKRPIGIYPCDVFWGAGEENLRKAINEKGKRYGALDKPFLLCINTLDSKTSGALDIENAIWGSLALSWSNDPSNKNEKWIRKLNGVFFNSKSARIKDVSGIMITKALPFNTKNNNYWIFEHPFCTNKIDFQKLNLTYYYEENDQIKKQEGKKLNDIID